MPTQPRSARSAAGSAAAAGARVPGPAGAGESAAAGALATAADAVGDRWSLLVVSRLLAGPRRFGELLAELDGLAPNILATRLARLESDGLVVGEPYSTRPVRHSYRLTASGAELAGPLRMLAGWGARRHAAGAAAAGPRPGVPAHDRCGTPLDARWFCPSCDEVVDVPWTPEGPAAPDEADLWWM
jgi:DNA-binding HxlR family transcriptional regulator